MIKRHFLGWDQPVSVKVADFLLHGRTGSAVDLSGMLVLVPTRQAGRRLRQLLIERCAARGAGLFPPKIETPAFLVAPAPQKGQGIATDTDELCCWLKVLRQTVLSSLPALFPLPPDRADFGWSLRTARMLQALRSVLIEGGWLLEDVGHLGPEALEEPERWADLAALEGKYAAELARAGKIDGCRLQKQAAAFFLQRAAFSRIVVAAVPDPMPLSLQVLQNAATVAAIDILIHAPEDRGDLFDQWGRPLAAQWREQQLDIETPGRRIVLCGTAEGQCRKVLELLAADQDDFSASATGIGVADSNLAAPLVRSLRDHGLAAYDPAGVRLKSHALCHLLSAFAALLADGSYASLAALLRHADLLSSLAKERKVSVAGVLTGLDLLQNAFLPQTADDAWRLVDRLPAPAAIVAAVREALAMVRQFLARFAETSCHQAVEALLVKVYGHRLVDPRHKEDRDFSKAAARVRSLLDEFGAATEQMAELSASEQLQFFVERLAQLSFYPDHDDAAIELDGWLELPWLATPLLVVCGMNEGAVPTSQGADPFLPDSLCRKLKIRSSDTLLARDAFLLTGLIESRRKEGRLYLLAGKYSTLGEPLVPSRLFFQCPDEHLTGRAASLFRPVEEAPPAVRRSIGFQLDPNQAVRKYDRLEQLPVIAFAAYLKCPFRFYLRHVLGMESMDDQKSEMDALDFGSLAHGALELLGRDAHLRQSSEPAFIARALGDYVAQEGRKRYGSSPPLQLTIQLASLARRLERAAAWHAEMVAEGWRIVDVEMERSLVAEEGVMVRGRLDRLDQHQKSGCYRIIDYKTGEKALFPDKVHLGSVSDLSREYALFEEGGKIMCWKDLQLPLYFLLLASDGIRPDNCEAGFFTLPKAVSETAYNNMAACSPAHLASAERCMRGVLADIGSGRFWPPAALGNNDEFGELFCEPADLLFRVPASG